MSIPKQRPPYQRRRRDSSGDRVSSSISGVSSASELNLPSCFLHRSEAPSYDRLKENFLREGSENQSDICDSFILLSCRRGTCLDEAFEKSDRE